MNMNNSGTVRQAVSSRGAASLLAALFLMLVIGLAHAQVARAPEPMDDGLLDPNLRQPSQDVRLNADHFKSYVSDTKSIITSPLSWKPSDWLKFSLIVGATVALAQEEDDLQSWMRTKRNDDTNFAADLAEPLGNGRYVFPALGALYCYGRFSGNDRASRTALLGVESVIVSWAITGTIKYLSHKHRPIETTADDIPWDGPSFSSAHVSFPSGHSTCAFAIATVVASEYGDHAFVRPLSYGAAALTAYSRVHDNAHWPSDIIIGSAIGHFTARAIIGLHGGTADTGFSLVPTVDQRGPNLSLSYRF
jgi:membrane-associated phospholipid phosphatase